VKLPAFLGSSYQAQSPTALNERTINWYAERLEMPGGKSKVQLYPTPGVEAFVSSSIYAPARGSFYQNGRCFFAKGGQLVEVSSTMSETARGSIPYSDANPATFAANGDAGDQLFLVSGSGVRLLNLNSNVMSTPSVEGTPVMAAYLDGYFMYLDNASRLFISALFDGSSWSAADTQSRSAAPDPWKAVAVNKSDKLIWLFGEETSEPWFDAGTSPYPFKPVQGGLLPYGIKARFSVKQVGPALMYLARTTSSIGTDVVMLNGLQPRLVGTPALHVALASYDRLDDAVGDTYEHLGHRFYLLRFPSARKTWAFDTATNEWHERATWISEDNEFVAQRTFYHVAAFDKILVGDTDDGAIYQLSDTSGVDVDSRPIRRIRRGPSLSYENKRIFYHDFELLLESGLGVLTGQGSDPRVMMRFSNDGGKTWSNEQTCSAGARGQYGARVRWNRLGSARDRQFEVSVSDPIPWKLVDAFIEAEPGTEVAA
jgi:hypothetical protein